MAADDVSNNTIITGLKTNLKANKLKISIKKLLNNNAGDKENST
jgi:hypothetical protein